MYLPRSASKARLREAEKARNNRREIVKALSHGQINRRDLLRMGLMTAAGSLVLTNGLSVFARSAYARHGGDDSGPTGAPRSSLFGVQPFSTPMPRFDVMKRHSVDALDPAPTAESNQTQQLLDPALPGVTAGDTGPIEGRPPGPIWAHQDFAARPPKVAIIATQEGARNNGGIYDPAVASDYNGGIDPTAAVDLRFHPDLPTQNPANVWTFNGTIPPKLLMGRHGEASLFRPFKPLPSDPTQNAGVGRHTIS